ncbi:FUSC family protein [Nitratireductor aquimarinus]|uniref:FUSC family protein n=1 Tax=Alphaproteobacteria TaxID=28211 RepID=UPI0019D3A240|nr:MULTISPECIES: FUSC family protein [Alphaproteobacteria]MBN7755575.1 FUSC family protein [Nitratireductor aquimarinus]MBY5998330.1 FUSC family protein [Tritonibacter mobilis]MBY6020361.1 FUSC family protein [Nitratireductor sp. DP7N14-4]
MSTRSHAAQTRPNSWLRELTRLKPAHWPIGRCLRASLSVALPILAGIMSGSAGSFMVMSLGALGLCLGEKDSPYIERFREVAIIAPIGALGFFLGYVGHLDWAFVVAAMTVVAFVVGLIGSYGSVLASALVQALLMGCIAIALPAIAPFWKPAAYFLAGCGFYAVLLGVEALFFRKRPFIVLVANLLEGLSRLALARSKNAEAAEEETIRRTITDKMSTGFASLLSGRYHQHGRPSAHLDWESSVLQGLSRIFTATLASNKPDNLEQAAHELKRLAALVRDEKPAPAADGAFADTLLSRSVEHFTAMYWSAGSSEKIAPPHVASGAVSVSKRVGFAEALKFDREAIRSAAVLALCVCIAFATRWVNDGNHWYWTPLTVIIVLRPDLGSIFVRSVHRVIGTVLGVLVGVAAFALFPKGIALVCVLAVLAGILPWAAQRAYWMATFVATPMVLILIDITSPGAGTTDYGLQRLVDTLIGGAIILVFGYFIWPRTHSHELERSFQSAREKIAAYLLALKPVNASQPDPQIGAKKRQAYVALAAMRKKINAAMLEPAPAGPEAAAWYPLVTGAERVCDGIGAWSARYTVAENQEAIVDALAARIAGSKPDGCAGIVEDEVNGDPFMAFASNICAAFDQIDGFMEKKDVGAKGQAAPAAA